MLPAPSGPTPAPSASTNGPTPKLLQLLWSRHTAAGHVLLVRVCELNLEAVVALATLLPHISITHGGDVRMAASDENGGSGNDENSEDEEVVPREMNSLGSLEGSSGRSDVLDGLTKIMFFVGDARGVCKSSPSVADLLSGGLIAGLGFFGTFRAYFFVAWFPPSWPSCGLSVRRMLRAAMVIKMVQSYPSAIGAAAGLLAIGAVLVATAGDVGRRARAAWHADPARRSERGEARSSAAGRALAMQRRP